MQSLSFSVLRERRAREALMAEVMEGRQQQLEDKIAEIKREQLKKLHVSDFKESNNREEKRKLDQQKNFSEGLQSQLQCTFT